MQNEELELYLDEDKIADLLQNFQTKDLNGSGYISIKDIPEVIRNSNINISERDCRKAVLELENELKYNINYSDLRMLVERNLRDFDAEEEIIEAFKVFDKNNTNLIDSKEFKKIILNLEEKITEEDVDEMISEGNPDSDGLIDYVKFVKLILYR